jgi:hypothetical protein
MVAKHVTKGGEEMMAVRAITTSLCLLLMSLTSVVYCENSIAWSYDFEDLNNGQYTYTFHFFNYGPAKDALFKIHIDGGAVPKQWATVSWDTPEGWTGDRADGYLDWSTGNGSYPADGVYRLWGQTGAPVQPAWTSQTFSWTFVPNGGPTPTATFFNASDVAVHVQRVDDSWVNYGASYRTNPVTVPEPSSCVLPAFSLASMGYWAFRRRRGAAA